MAEQGELAVDPDEPRDMEFGLCAVAVMDVLGQSNALEEMDRVFCDHAGGEPPPEFMDLVKRTFGVVEGARKQVQAIFRDFVAAYSTEEQLAALTPEYREAYRSVRYCELSTTRFSDTIVCHAPLRSSQGNVTASGVVPLLAAAGSVMLINLAAGHPIRCGIDVGLLAEFPDRVPYGAALSRAHHMESKIAGHPRVVVSKRLLEFLDLLGTPTGNGHVDGMNQRLSALAKSMICTDTDSHSIIDYLGEAFAERLAPELRSVVFEKGHAFITTSLEGFEEAGNTKLIGRYRRLQRYYESRKQYWT